MARVCSHLGCPKLALDRGRYCAAHRVDHQRRKREQRTEAGLKAQSWYRSREWFGRKAKQLKAQPHCQSPMHEGQQVRATIADHIEPHRGDEHKFWHGALQSLCKPCHDGWKQRLERGSVPPDGFSQNRLGGGVGQRFFSVQNGGF